MATFPSQSVQRVHAVPYAVPYAVPRDAEAAPVFVGPGRAGDVLGMTLGTACG
ncbi:hypothetical protein [Terrabacter sp. BE26]|uniref:hypothetical protein n=1 Tax=Terrabacter sp. BE26 TaxID=2898152 RepID=UPI0035BE1331